MQGPPRPPGAAPPGGIPGMKKAMSPEMAEALDKKRRERMVKDTYEVRCREGRPIHGMSSIFVVLLGSACWMMQFGAIVMPYWRSNWTGVLGYPSPRSWGLWAVNGVKQQGYYAQQGYTCAFYAQLNVGGMCASPLCVWYKSKCVVYMEMMMTSYGTGTVFVLELIIHTLCIFWTCQMTPRSLRWAGTWWFMCCILHLGATGFWIFMSAGQFNTLEEKAYYPTPGIGPCVYVTATCFLGLMTCSFFGCGLWSMWPEVTDSDSEEEDEDFDGDQLYLQQQQGYDPASDPNCQQPAYDPNYQQGGYDQQGGYPQQQQQQPGYDPNFQQQQPGYDPNFQQQQPGYDPNFQQGGYPQQQQQPAYDPNPQYQQPQQGGYDQGGLQPQNAGSSQGQGFAPTGGFDQGQQSGRQVGSDPTYDQPIGTNVHSGAAAW